MAPLRPLSMHAWPEIFVLGPTASGKTRLAVALANELNGAIISADSRQVYRQLDIGTGKDLHEYGSVPHFLINCVDAGAKFNVADYLSEVSSALKDIAQREKTPIICGGSGLYLQALIQGVDSHEIPVNSALRDRLLPLSKDELRAVLSQSALPDHFTPDVSTHKRLIRAIEISQWLQDHPNYEVPAPLCPNGLVFGLNPDRNLRRTRISERLTKRLEEGLVKEVSDLLANGLTADELIYYGLEYKYTTQYLLGEFDFDTYKSRLETEIHRFSKRQMTYFRKMEKDGIRIHWLESEDANGQLREIFQHLQPHF